MDSTTSSTPWAARCPRTRSIIVTSATRSICLGVVKVRGRSRVPSPPTRTTALTGAVPAAGRFLSALERRVTGGEATGGEGAPPGRDPAWQDPARLSRGAGRGARRSGRRRSACRRRARGGDRTGVGHLRRGARGARTARHVREVVEIGRALRCLRDVGALRRKRPHDLLAVLEVDLAGIALVLLAVHPDADLGLLVTALVAVLHGLAGVLHARLGDVD